MNYTLTVKVREQQYEGKYQTLGGTVIREVVTATANDPSYLQKIAKVFDWAICEITDQAGNPLKEENENQISLTFKEFENLLKQEETV